MNSCDYLRFWYFGRWVLSWAPSNDGRVCVH